MLPVTGLWSAVTVVPYATVVPYSKVTVVEAPLALTVPFNVAPVNPTAVAVPVVAVGAGAAVVNETSLP